MRSSSPNSHSRPIAIALSLWVLLILPGCMSGHDRYRPVQLARDDAVIYIYRPRSLLSPGPIDVFLDQTSAGRLGRNTFVALIVKPGEHLIRVQRRSDATRLVRIGESQSIFLEARASLLGGQVSLTDPGEAPARERIARTRQAREPVRITRAAPSDPD